MVTKLCSIPYLEYFMSDISVIKRQFPVSSLITHYLLYFLIVFFHMFFILFNKYFSFMNQIPISFMLLHNRCNTNKHNIVAMRLYSWYLFVILHVDKQFVFINKDCVPNTLRIFPERTNHSRSTTSLIKAISAINTIRYKHKRISRLKLILFQPLCQSISVKSLIEVLTLKFVTCNF